MRFVVAVVVLSLGFTTLVAVQTTQLSNYERERNIFRASLYSQYIMAAIEIHPSPPAEGSDSGALGNKLSELGYFGYEAVPKSKSREMDEIEGWSWEQQVDEVPVAEREDALRRLRLTIRWGQGPADEFRLVYYAFVPRGASR